jgi:hypothetical protein
MTAVLLALALTAAVPAEAGKITVDAARPGHPVSPLLWGISFGYLVESRRGAVALGSGSSRWPAVPTKNPIWLFG